MDLKKQLHHSIIKIAEHRKGAALLPTLFASYVHWTLPLLQVQSCGQTFKNVVNRACIGCFGVHTQ
jgi:hypothetical protein